jgi:cell division protein FtsQ
MSAVKPRIDPAPSRLRYRLSRLARRKSLRKAVRLLTMPLIIAGVGWWLAGQGALWVEVERMVLDARRSLEERPEFAVTRLEILGASEELEAELRGMLATRIPASSLALALDDIRREVEASPRVATAQATVAPGGALVVQLTERVPVALWRVGGKLKLIDKTGVVIAFADSRADRLDLPLIVGAGAERAVGEALALHQFARPLWPRLRGLVRVGERRWTVALDRGQVIYLPEKAPDAALSQAISLDYSDDLLSRDVAVIDLRNPARPVLRLTDEAMFELLRIRALVAGDEA